MWTLAKRYDIAGPQDWNIEVKGLLLFSFEFISSERHIPPFLSRPLPKGLG